MRFLIFLFFPLTCFCQVNELSPRLKESFSKYTTSYTPEKLYASTDRSVYRSGDSIFFRLFFVDARTHEPLQKGSNLFVDLVSPSGAIIAKAILNPSVAPTSGRFSLIDTLPSGFYTLRAYTRWMSDFDQGSIYNRPLLIHNKKSNLQFYINQDQEKKDTGLNAISISLFDRHHEKISNTKIEYQFEKMPSSKAGAITTDAAGIALIPIPPEPTGMLVLKAGKDRFYIPLSTIRSSTGNYIRGNEMHIDIQFFSEGQQIINGVQNKIVVVARDVLGRMVSISGTVNDQFGRLATKFSTNEKGIGTFNLFAVKGRIYTAIPDSINKSIPLPVLNDSSYQLAIVSRNHESVRLRVSLGDALYKKNTRSSIVAVAGNRIVFAANGMDMYEVNMSLKDLPPGITTLTLFNDKLQPVSERSVFIPPAHLLSVETQSNISKAREKHSIKISKINDTDPATGNSIQTGLKMDDSSGLDLAIAIADKSLSPRNQSNISSYLLLESELKIPGFKAEDLNDGSIADLWMITYTNFNWNRILTGIYPNFKGSGEQTLNLQGWVQDKNGKPAVDRVLAIYSNDNKGGILVDTTDAFGSFSLKDLTYTDTARFIVQSRNKRGIKQPDTIYVTENNFPILPFNPMGVHEYASIQPITRMAYAKKLYEYDSTAGFENAQQLETVIISSRKAADSRNKRRATGFSSIVSADQVMQLGAVNIAEALLIIPGVVQVGQYIRIRGAGSITGTSQQQEPLLVIDGTQYPSFDSSGSIRSILSSIPANIVDFIEVLKGGEAAIYGTRGANGVILIYTKSDFTMGFGWKEPGVLAFQASGYHILEKYKAPGDIMDSKFDARSTLLWEGNVFIKPAEKQQEIEFYTSDIPTPLLIKLEGISENGKIIYIEKNIDLSDLQ